MKIFVNDTDQYPQYEKNSFVMVVDEYDDRTLSGTLIKVPKSHKNDIGYSEWNRRFFKPCTEELELEFDESQFTNNRLRVSPKSSDRKLSIIDFNDKKIYFEEKKFKLKLKNKA